MSNDLEQSYTDIKKKRILSILPPNLELSSIASCKLYTSGVQGKKWLFSDLDGLLCFLLDYQNKTRFLALYDSFSFEKVFQYELYVDFGKAFMKLADDFRAFEVDNGFIGLQFDYASEAKQFDIIIKKCEGNFLKSLFENKPFTKKLDTTEKMKSYARILKESFASGDDYDENYAEDGTEISKARSFEMLNNISYNKEAKQFEIGEISDELRKIFIAAGLRKKDLKNDLDFAFQMFKKIILGVSENKDLLYTDYFRKQYSPPVSQTNKNDSDDEDEDNESNSTNNSQNDNKFNNNTNMGNSNLRNTMKVPVSQSHSNLGGKVNVNTNNKPINNAHNTNANTKVNQINSSNKASSNTKLTPSQISQNKQIATSKPQPKSVIPVKETKPIETEVTQSRQSVPVNSLPKFNFQPPKQVNQPVSQVKKENTTVSHSTNKPKTESIILGVSNPEVINTQNTEQPSIQNPPTLSIPTPPTLSIPTPPTLSIPTPPTLSIPTPPTLSIPTPPTLSIPQPPTFTIPVSPQSQNIPQPPPLNVPIPPPFSLDLSMANIPITSNDNPQQSREEELTSIKLKKVQVEEVVKAPSMYEQIQNVKLKAVSKKENAQIITKNEKNYLQSSLAAAIQQRRKNLMKHQDDDNDSEDEDW